MSEKIDIVMRQTNYDKEMAETKLKEHGDDIMKVINEYMEIPEKQEAPMVSVNQEKFRQFRKLVEDQNNNYVKNELAKNNEKKINA